VWAPHADKVYVTGTFNDWSDTATPLEREENGYWSTAAPNAKTGDEYKFLIHGPQGPVPRIDPYARKVTNSIGNGVIYDPQAFDWGDDAFTMATGNELVIYEMHVGTFHVKDAGQVGTFDTAIEKLPYLQELGINAVELMPLAEFPGDFSWGYNPAHPFAVETIYGGPDGLKRFVKRPTSMVSRLSSMSSTTTSAPRTCPCGSLTGGATTTKAASISTMITARKRPGAIHAPIMAVGKCASICAITP